MRVSSVRKFIFTNHLTLICRMSRLIDSYTSVKRAWECLRKLNVNLSWTLILKYDFKRTAEHITKDDSATTKWRKSSILYLITITKQIFSIHFFYVVLFCFTLFIGVAFHIKMFKYLLLKFFKYHLHVFSTKENSPFSTNEFYKLFQRGEYNFSFARGTICITFSLA